MTFVLDAGALIALDRGDRSLAALLKLEALEGKIPRTHGGVVAQAWRGGSKQAVLARALRSVDVVPLSRGLGAESGLLLGASGTSDVVDAAVVCIAEDGDTILTSDPGDLAHLVEVAGFDVTVTSV